MFNPKRFARFLARLLIVFVPVLAIVFPLALVSEVYHRAGEWSDLVASWSFWLAIMRNLLPTLLALVAVYALAVRFVQALYGIESFAEARGLVNRCIFGLQSFRPWLKVAGGIAEADEKHIMMRVGGPGHLVVYNDSAILLERGGYFTQVQKSGFPRLHPFERPYHVVDLRPIREVYKVNAMSKEGIPVACEADITYQIDNEGLQPTETQPFPAPEEKIFQAASCTWIREADQPQESRTMDWGGRIIISETEGNLRTILARYPLDTLIGLSSSQNRDTREEIRQQLESELVAAAPKLGARILKVELGDIRVGDEIAEQWIKAWHARWASWATERQAMGKAKQVEQLEEAKTHAQVMMIKAITGAFKPMAVQDQAVSSRLILARLFMVLGRASSEPLTRVFLPPEAMNTLKLLQDMIR